MAPKPKQNCKTTYRDSNIPPGFYPPHIKVGNWMGQGEMKRNVKELAYRTAVNEAMARFKFFILFLLLPFCFIFIIATKPAIGIHLMQMLKLWR
jgi:hypothetical protein